MSDPAHIANLAQFPDGTTITLNNGTAIVVEADDNGDVTITINTRATAEPPTITLAAIPARDRMRPRGNQITVELGKDA